jgi:hypothetical protein
VTEAQETEKKRSLLEGCLNILIAKLGRIQIGTPAQFPYGWRKAAKGRTVWRILEEAIAQNLEKHHEEMGIADVVCSDSEVSVFDVCVTLKDGDDPLYINVKSSVEGRTASKDDISKADGLLSFYEKDLKRQLFIASFGIRFDDRMFIEFTHCIVMPIVWLPDVYVNPSNNGNLQSSYYRDLDKAEKRTQAEFLLLLKKGNELARQKRHVKLGKLK